MASIVVAYCKENRVIGNEGKIPWNIPEDLKLFKELTKDNIVIMGRKTWESLPKKPLPDRMNVVLTKDANKSKEIADQSKGVFCASSLDTAIHMSQLILPESEIFIIGGSKVYEQALKFKFVEKIYASEIKENYEGDTYFPKINGYGFVKNIISENELFDFCEYTS